MLLPMFEFHEPLSIEEALELKKKLGQNARILAGGTDLLVHLKKKLVKTDNLISLSRIKALSLITEQKDSIFIGACATMAQISRSPVIAKKFTALKSGCDNLGNHLIRNRATIGGNACNASPAGDTLPALLIYDSVALLESYGKKREIPIADFFTGPGKSCIQPDEILTGFRLPIPTDHSGAHYIQLGKRKSSEINVVNVASFLEYDPGTKKVITTRIALGSVAATPIRAARAEAALLGQAPEEASFFAAAEMARREDCRPIDDFRGTAGYRQAMVGVLTKRTLATAYERAKGA
ncbi:MAG: xanthine dehydrogenase family protein subunit M [Proteobacteria bacterium]|nr:xanthine dehydrogenase family protein subunit M [Desulfobacula sp.]MBU4129857.1 xanthine dehydrogenase family protein subunit M [Pseudomonadota bacterium]